MKLETETIQIDNNALNENVENSFWEEFINARLKSTFERIIIACFIYVIAFILQIKTFMLPWLGLAVLFQILDSIYAKKLIANISSKKDRNNYIFMATLSSVAMSLVVIIFWFSNNHIAQMLIPILVAGALFIITMTANKIKNLSNYLNSPYIIIALSCFTYEFITESQYHRIHTFALIISTLAILIVNYITMSKRLNISQNYKQALIDAEEKRIEAEKSNENKSHFLATISHELRTPLNAILGSATLIGQQNIDIKTKELLGTMINASQGMISLLNDLLDLSKIEAGKMEFEDLVYSPEHQIKKSTELFTGPLTSKNLKLEININESLPKAIHGDPTRVGQIINNLLSNAIKFTEKGSIIVKANCDDKFVYISVKDSGIGLTPEGISRLFKPFSQAEKSTSRHHGGTGLGLSTAHNLATLMGGDLVVESEYGHGATFTLSLPKIIADDSELPKEELDLDNVSPMADGETIRVLAADDNASNRFILKSFLDLIAAETTLVSDGLEAVEAAKDNDYDIILLDVRMPALDGLGACREIRKLGGNNQNVPIIMVSADAGPTHVKLGTAAGANGYISKPILAPTLFAALEEHLGS